MYKIFSRYIRSPEMWTPESPFAAVKECGGTLYGFWVRPVNFCCNVSPRMEEAVERAFADARASAPDEVMDRVFREWTKAVYEYHDKEKKLFAPDIFKKYQFEMQVLVASPDGRLAVRSYNMEGMFDLKSKMKEAATGRDAVCLSLARGQGFMGECEPECAGILAFKDGAHKGNKYVYDWNTALLMAACEADGAGDPVGEKFEGSYLLAVDMNKLHAYRSRKDESRPYITLKTSDSKFGFYAEKGKIRYSDMELLAGGAPSAEEYFEVTEVTEEYVGFIADGKYFDGGESKKIKLGKGETKSFKHTEHQEVSMADGDFDFAYTFGLTVSWEE